MIPVAEGTALRKCYYETYRFSEDLDFTVIDHGPQVPIQASLEATPFRAEVESEWGNMLAHQLSHLPPFGDFWGSLGAVFELLGDET